MILADTILKEYRVTEKAAILSANLNQYTFEVAPSANRIEVARAVAKVFNVEVTKVNILNKKPKVKTDRSRRGRPGTKGGHKKAIVTLKEGDKIELV
ncbi:MAG: 50S ribosomal protein L23 [Opitutales bacterium]|jgi:large subunit ribosomal protein L23|nr:50S ribosomal protein L23 [Opitutales bacterium]MDP4644705.1 50S ribosomal protein L23 [Opitutales bacterium]MDP4693301.1 50S ribosomal protein L23 [Opitutales bacterium]MDP4777554.1 50S ribosomal protein L23 [Opitutales bacterium]MDP4879279.1 50S ribosomal protein L23 [Opitutales bacterium]